MNSLSNSTVVKKFHIAGIPNDSAACVVAFLDAVFKSALDAQKIRKDGNAIQVNLYLNPNAVKDLEMVRHWCWEAKQSIPDWVSVNEEGNTGSNTSQTLPEFTLHSSNCVNQSKGPVFTSLHRNGRMKMVEPGVRCSSVDLVVVGLQGIKHRVKWLTTFEEFKRLGSPQVAFAEGIMNAKTDFGSKKIDVMYDPAKYLPIIVTNRGINITNVTVDRIHVIGLPHCGNTGGFLDEIWEMATALQKRKTSPIQIILYGPVSFGEKQKNPGTPTWEHVLRWCELRKLQKPSMLSTPEIIELDDSDEDKTKEQEQGHRWGKSHRKTVKKAMPELVSLAPAVTEGKVDLTRQFASFTLALGNEHVSKIVLFVGTNATVRDTP